MSLKNSRDYIVLIQTNPSPSSKTFFMFENADEAFACKKIEILLTSRHSFPMRRASWSKERREWQIQV